MFGIIRPCRHSLPPDLLDRWRAHVCGLCLGLRDGHGQLARLATNVDAAALSVLTDAQRPQPAETRRAAPCPLRSFRAADVVRGDDPAIAHAAAVSLTVGSVRIADHVSDGDGWAGRVPWVPSAIARRWSGAGERAAAGAAFDVRPLRAAVAASARLERSPGLTFDDYVSPTEAATAAACRHTAVVAGRPANAGALDALGRSFGRMVYVLDAVLDLRDDEANGAFNPLLAAVADPDRRVQVAADLVTATHAQVTDAFERLDLSRPELARAVFVDEVHRAGRRALRIARGDGAVCRHHDRAVASDGAGDSVADLRKAADAGASGKPRRRRHTWGDACDCCCGCGDLGDGCCGCCDCCGCDC